MKNSRFLVIMFLVTAIATIAQTMPKNIKKLLNAQYAISAFYVDSVNEDKVVEDAIRGILNELDPHSTYTTATETEELDEPLQGSFSGIGIQFNMNQDTLYVIQTIAGGPSERVGLRAGDRIVAVNDTVIAGKKMKTNDIMKRLRGPKDTKVEVKVKRGRSPELITFRITRDNIPLYSIDASYMLDSKTGYVKIARFAAGTNDEFVRAIDSLKHVGMQQLIIDLTDNGGGYLNSAIEMGNELLERDNLIVYTEGRTSPRNDATAIGNGHFRKGKVAVLVNQYSASASEILSGAIQDWDRGVIVGRRTFGKGLVQRPLRFEDGSMIRLTVARYYTPSGRCIQKPYTKGDKLDYEMDIVNRYRAGELQNADSIHFADSLRYSTLKNKRVIYGGGGIMPDVFVPLDTTEYSNYYRDLVAKGVIVQFCLDYVDKHRTAITAKYPTVQKFDEGFSIDQTIINDVIAAGERD
ncbi:MAG: S41 family peptidase, partial [Muribaculaceae bacterium]